MSTRRISILTASCVVAIAAGYFVACHTWVGLALRGTCRLYLRNDSNTPLRNVRIPIANSIQPAVTSRFDIIRPNQRVRVPVPKSHIYIGKIVWEQGQRTNAFLAGPGIKVSMGNTMELVVNSNGSISTVDDY